MGYRVWGQMAEAEGGSRGCIEECYDDLNEAIERAAKLVQDMQPGGVVLVCGVKSKAFVTGFVYTDRPQRLFYGPTGTIMSANLNTPNKD